MLQEKTELLDYFRDYCKANNIYFCPGEESYQNFLADEKIYGKYDLILTFDMSLQPVFSEGGVNNVRYSGYISLGQKREECTESSLDEFFEQKYDRRLKNLTKTLLTIFETLSCQEEIDFEYCQLDYVLNHFDVNIDFVRANVRILV